MKIPALLTLLLAAVLSALPLSHARADDVSFDVFYNSLTDQGAWYNTPDYGYVWQPNVGYQNDKWRPYTDGYWAQTDDGWTWVSYENFGWATYHYGRWTNLEGTGWVWVPGYEWGPGWVSWRTSDDYVGWAPLPPAQHETSNGGGGASLTVDYNTVEPESGYYGAVDQTYDIGPANYCFVETRSFGAPVLREVIIPPQRNIIIIENTVNVTNIVYNRSGPRVIVYNGGPDFAFISARVDRPIQRLRIEQNNNYDFARGPRDHNPNLVRDGVFQVAAPTIARRPMNFAELRPPTVKRDLPAPRIEHGWSNTGADPAAVQRVRQQFQQQARQLPPRPTGNPAAAFTPPANPRGRDARTTVPPSPATTPVAGNTPPRGNSNADIQARRDAALRDREARDAQTNGGQPRPAVTPGGQPFQHPGTSSPSRPEQPGGDPRADRPAYPGPRGESEPRPAQPPAGEHAREHSGGDPACGRSARGSSAAPSGVGAFGFHAQCRRGGNPPRPASAGAHPAARDPASATPRPRASAPSRCARRPRRPRRARRSASRGRTLRPRRPPRGRKSANPARSRPRLTRRFTKTIRSRLHRRPTATTTGSTSNRPAPFRPPRREGAAAGSIPNPRQRAPAPGVRGFRL